MSKKVYELDFRGKKLVIENGEYAKQAPLENNPEIPPSSREEGLRLLHGLATNLATSLQTPQEA